MSEFWYDIKQFDWNKNLKVFYAESDLFPRVQANGFAHGSRQFYIINKKTGNFRRFRLYRETEKLWGFESEDRIKCVIRKPSLELEWNIKYNGRK